MRQESIKLELIEWLAKLNDVDVLHFLKLIKETHSKTNDWWMELPEIQKNGISRGLQDIDQGNVISHDDVKKKYGV